MSADTADLNLNKKKLIIIDDDENSLIFQKWNKLLLFYIKL